MYSSPEAAEAREQYQDTMEAEARAAFEADPHFDDEDDFDYDEDERDDEDYDPCQCSDPGCPCSGRKHCGPF